MKHKSLITLLISICVIALTAFPVLTLTNAFILPSVYENTFLGEMKYKIKRLKELDGKRIILIGGSSVPFGVRSDLVMENLPDYQVVDFGMYASLGTDVMLDFAKARINEGDIVIYMPEQHEQTLSLYYNGHSIWQALDGDYQSYWLLPKEKSTTGRIDYYCAEGLLAKVYLTRAGVSGSLNSSDLAKAAEYSKDVIENSGRALLTNYSDIFRGSNNNSDESLFAWKWTVGSHWTCQNTLQSDLAPEGFDENGDCWGGWGGPSLDLIEAFGVSPKDDPAKRIDKDSRRKATVMLAGDIYDYFWRDHDLGNNKKGFDYLRFWYDKTYNAAATGECQAPCGGTNVKHLYGDNADHIAETGLTPGRMAYAFSTHILRLADVYLVNAEAHTLLDGGSTTNADALYAFNQVHQRAVPSDVEKSSLTFDEVWKERRLELAGEGDRWYDFVRRSYYDVNSCIKEITAQKRNSLWGCNIVYKRYYESGKTNWSYSEEDGEFQYDEATAAPNVTAASFSLPFPTEDVALNPNLATSAASIHVDVRNTYSY